MFSKTNTDNNKAELPFVQLLYANFMADAETTDLSFDNGIAWHNVFSNNAATCNASGPDKYNRVVFATIAGGPIIPPSTYLPELLIFLLLSSMSLD